MEDSHLRAQPKRLDLRFPNILICLEKILNTLDGERVQCENEINCSQRRAGAAHLDPLLVILFFIGEHTSC